MLIKENNIVSASTAAQAQDPTSGDVAETALKLAQDPSCEDRAEIEVLKRQLYDPKTRDNKRLKDYLIIRMALLEVKCESDDQQTINYINWLLSKKEEAMKFYDDNCLIFNM